jgi:hypothetical protein
MQTGFSPWSRRTLGGIVWWKNRGLKISFKEKNLTFEAIILMKIIKQKCMYHGITFKDKKVRPLIYLLVPLLDEWSFTGHESWPSWSAWGTSVLHGIVRASHLTNWCCCSWSRQGRPCSLVPVTLLDMSCILNVFNISQYFIPVLLYTGTPVPPGR